MNYSWSYVCFILNLTIAFIECSSDVIVEISSGILRGNVQETWTKHEYMSFKGIPYAEPPIGELRFKAPVTVKSWKGIKNATKDGNVCPQSDPNFVGGQIDEDCLYLNVYTKKLQGNQPVVIWMHPGGFRFMTGASFWYGPDYLLDHDIVVVSFNYRLDTLGFLSTGDNYAVGNYGMKDQVEVLRWVKQNIRHFGGDPKRVTLAGDSAGSAAVLLHMMSPMSQGLFHKVIAMSGGIFGNIKWLKSEEQKIGAEKLSNNFNCPTKPVADMVQCLRKIPANELTKEKDFEAFSGRNVLDFGPVIEPVLESGEGKQFLVEHPLTLLKKKSFQKVPIVTGFTEKEFVGRGVAIARNESLVKKLNDKFDELLPLMFEYDDKSQEDIANITKSIRKFYFGNRTINNSSAEPLGEMFSDFFINFGEYLTAKLLSQFSEKPVYFYKFSYIGRYGQEYDPITNKTLGPGHTNDISYLLYPSKLFPKFKETDPEGFVVKRMTSMWYNFASSGNPIPTDSSIQWNSVSEGKYLNIDKLLTLEDGMPFSERMKFWETLFPL